MAYEILASLAVGVLAIAENSIYLELKRRWLFVPASLAVAAAFFCFSLVPGQLGQFAYVVAVSAGGCVLLCAACDTSTYDEVYTALIQCCVTCAIVYFSERTAAFFAEGGREGAAPPWANEHFVDDPATFALIVLLHALWLLSMYLAYRTILRHTPFSDDVYRVCCALQGATLGVELLLMFFGEDLILALLPFDLATCWFISAFAMLSTAGVLGACVYANWHMAEAHRAELIESQNALMKSYIDNVAKTIGELRVFRHDQRHLLGTLSALLSAGGTDEALALVGQMTEQLEQPGGQVFCDDGIVNAVLADTCAHCRKSGVSLNATVRLAEPLRLDEIERVSLLKNTLDNALESCRKLADPAGADINLQLICERGMLVLQCDNPVDNPPAIRDNRIATTKRHEERKHGIGLESMHRIAAKHRGSLTIRCQGGRFFLNASMENTGSGNQAAGGAASPGSGQL